MKAIKIPSSLERPGLMKVSTEELLELVLRQQESIAKLVAKIERLKVNGNSDSRSSSKPPSADIHKRSEKEQKTEPGKVKGKRKPGR